MPPFLGVFSGWVAGGGNGGYYTHHACFVLKGRGGRIHFVLQDEVSTKVGLPLMGDTAGTKLREPIETRRLTAEYVNKTCILTCIRQSINRKKVLRAKTLKQNVL